MSSPRRASGCLEWASRCRSRPGSWPAGLAPFPRRFPRTWERSWTEGTTWPGMRRWVRSPDRPWPIAPWSWWRRSVPYRRRAARGSSPAFPIALRRGRGSRTSGRSCADERTSRRPRMSLVPSGRRRRRPRGTGRGWFHQQPDLAALAPAGFPRRSRSRADAWRARDRAYWCAPTWRPPIVATSWARRGRCDLLERWSRPGLARGAKRWRGPDSDRSRSRRSPGLERLLLRRQS